MEEGSAIAPVGFIFGHFATIYIIPDGSGEAVEWDVVRPPHTVFGLELHESLADISEGTEFLQKIAAGSHRGREFDGIPVASKV